MKIGLLLANYNCFEYLEECLAPWIEYRKNYDVKIAIVDGRFKEFGGETQNSNDGSVELLEKYLSEGKIDFFEKLNEDKTEHGARNVGLNYLLNEGADVIISIGSDEKFTVEQIKRIFEYVKKEEFISVFRISYKNLTFSEKTYTLGFCPKRVFKTETNGYRLRAFRYDDDVEYSGKITRDIIKDDQLPQKTIPGISVLHETWLSNNRSKFKVEYQKKRWGENSCSFSWDYENNKLIWNKEFYKMMGQPIPEIFKDE